MKPRSIRSEVAHFTSPRIKVRSAELDFGAGRKTRWHYVELPQVVTVLPMDSKGNVYLVREWRLSWRKEVLQIPGGLCGGKTERSRLAQVHKELREEIGMDAKRIKKIASTYLSASTKSPWHIYLATGLFPSPKHPDPYEFLATVKMPFREAYKMFLDGKEKTTSATLLSFLWADKFLKS